MARACGGALGGRNALLIDIDAGLGEGNVY